LKLWPFRRREPDPAPQQRALADAADVVAARTQSSFAQPRGRASWDYGGAFLGQFRSIPNQEGFAVYAALREAVPAIDAMIGRMRGFVGIPEVEGDPDTIQELNAYLDALSVNRTQRGFSNFFGTWLDDALMFGRAHAEIILNRRQDDIFALAELHPRSIQMQPDPDGYHMQCVQQQRGGGQVVLPSSLLLTAIHDARTDDPSGTSMVWGLPLVGEIAAKIMTDQGLIWDRFGVPRFHINWEPEADFNDPLATESQAVMSSMAANFTQGQKDAAGGDIKDFYTSGKVTASIIGAGGETMAIEMPLRAMLEQIVARSGLPPFVYGFSWATTERMGAVQAGAMMAVIEETRNEVESELQYFLSLRQALGNRDPEVSLCWPKLTLMDRSESATAQLTEERADAQCFANAMRLWQNGALTRYEFARRVRPDLHDTDDAEIDIRLPDLPLFPPTAQVTNVGEGAAQQQGGTPGGGPILTGNGLYGYLMRSPR
jgi:hypothetical protein